MKLSTADSRALHMLSLGVLIVGLAYLGVCIGGRFGSPWPLEWMEGASVLHAQRLVRGLPLYAAPRADFIPFVYPPLSYVPMGLGLILSGGALWGARLASVAALALSIAALHRAARHVSSSRAVGLLAAGLFCFGYGYAGAFIDLARVDAWFCALTLCAIERLCARRPLQGLLLLALACFAKQHAVLLLAAASCGVLLEGWSSRRALTLARVLCAWAALIVTGTLLCWISDGWMWTYCVRVPARHGLSPRLLASFVLVDIFAYLPVLSGLALWSLWKRRGAQALLLHLLLLAAVAASALGRAHPGGDDNVRLPAYALLALVAAVSCGELLLRARARWPLTAALALQLAMLVQAPALHWSSRATDAGFQQLRAALMRCAGSSDFAAMDHSGLGEHAFVHTLALSDLRMNHDALGLQATDAVLAALGAPDRPAAFAISAAFPELLQTLAQHYELCERLPEMPMPTGYSLAPTYVYRRR